MNFSLDIQLGQPTDTADEVAFYGELSQVNIFANVLSSADVAYLASSCNATVVADDLLTWFDFDASKLSDATFREPYLCGDSDCPEGWTGTLCDIYIGMLKFWRYREIFTDICLLTFKLQSIFQNVKDPLLYFIDKSPPAVTGCPDTTTFVDNSNRLVQVDWVEPTFTDDVGVVDLTQTNRPSKIRA